MKLSIFWFSAQSLSRESTRSSLYNTQKYGHTFMSWIGFAEILFLKEHSVLETIPCRLAVIYPNLIGMRFIRLQPSKMTLQIEEVISCEMLVNSYGTTWCQSQMKPSQVTKSEFLLCSSMSSTCPHPLYTHIGLRGDVAFLAGLVNASN